MSIASVDTRLYPDQSETPAPPAALALPEVPPELIDHPRYRVLELVGFGGMGAVFKAEHKLMERVVALKVIRKGLTDRPAAVERFRLEVKAAARLLHPNIVTAHDAEQAGGVHFLVMEFAEGTSLDRVLRDGGPVSLAWACRWARQAALGLQHAHERGMVHRDLKPANLLLTPDGQIKILDFGLARFASEREGGGPLTQDGAVVGTPDYMAPEQALNSRQADIRADLYSLGCTLYHLLAGRPPFPEGSALHKLMAHQNQTPPPLTRLRSDVPAGLERVVERLLAKDPGRRYQTPAEVADALAPFAEQAEEPAPPLRQSGAPRRKWSRRWIVAAGVALLALGGGLGVLAWSLNRNGGRPIESRESVPVVHESRRIDVTTGPFTRVALSPDGRWALLDGADFSVRLWDLDKREEVARLTGHVGEVLGVAFSPDGKRALSGGIDTTVRLWDLEEHRLLKTLEGGHYQWVRAVAFTPDGEHAVSCGNDTRVVLWDLVEARPLHTFTGHLAPVGTVAVSGSGRYAVSGSWDQTLHLWDLEERRESSQFKGHDHTVRHAVFSTDGRFVLSGSADRTLRLWSVREEKEVCRFEGHTGLVQCVALSPDGRQALSGSEDRTIRLWDTATGHEIRRYEGHEELVLRVEFCSDGRRFVSASKDGTIRFWDLPTEESNE
jgi:WD40 repeat protein